MSAGTSTPGVVKAGSENKDIVSNLDFAETFLDLAGVDIPSDMQGRSIVSLLKGETPEDWPKTFYYQYYEYPGAHDVRRHYGVRTMAHKLIHFYNLNEWELYDLDRDPQELNNVYADATYAPVVAELKQELNRLRIELKVPEDTRPIEPKPGYS